MVSRSWRRPNPKKAGVAARATPANDFGLGTVYLHRGGLTKPSSPERIQIPDLEKKLSGKAKPVIVDVRKTAEMKESGIIPGAVHIPVDDVAQRIAEIPKDKDVIFYCGGGGRASRAAQAAWDAGYRKVGYCGLRDWKKRGLPTKKFTGE